MSKEAEPDIQDLAEQGRQNIAHVADMLGVPPEIYNRNPMALIPALQDWVSRAPFNQFEESDWVTLHSDLVCYLADFLVRKYGAHWRTEPDSTTPHGYRYVIEATGTDGQARRIDPTEIARMEFAALPIEIVRMLATAELELHLTSQQNE